MKQLVLLFAISLLLQKAVGQTLNKDDYLIAFTDTTTDSYGYKDRQGRVIINLDKYAICFTDTFKTYAIVLKPGNGFVAIDRGERVLYEVFPFDNGPDYVSEGLFRIVTNGKIGYADSKTGNVVIKPQFACAFPFENGLAKISLDCTIQADEEHIIWISKRWFYINKVGYKVERK